MQIDRIAFNPSRCCAGENILALQFDASAGIGILAANGATSCLRFIGSLSARENSCLDSKFPALLGLTWSPSAPLQALSGAEQCGMYFMP